MRAFTFDPVPGQSKHTAGQFPFKHSTPGPGSYNPRPSVFEAAGARGRRTAPFASAVPLRAAASVGGNHGVDPRRGMTSGLSRPGTPGPGSYDVSFGTLARYDTRPTSPKRYADNPLLARQLIAAPRVARAARRAPQPRPRRVQSVVAVHRGGVAHPAVFVAAGNVEPRDRPPLVDPRDLLRLARPPGVPPAADARARPRRPLVGRRRRHAVGRPPLRPPLERLAAAAVAVALARDAAALGPRLRPDLAPRPPRLAPQLLGGRLVSECPTTPPTPSERQAGARRAAAALAFFRAYNGYNQMSSASTLPTHKVHQISVR